MTISQGALTVVTAILPDHKDELNVLLTELGGNPSSNQDLPLGKVDTLHFGCFVVLNDLDDYPPYLVFEANYDGDLDNHLDQLISEGGTGLKKIFGFATEFPSNANDTQLKQFLKQHSIPNAAFYIAFRGHSVASLKNAIAVRVEIENFLDLQQADNKLEGLSSQQVVERIQSHMVKPDVITPTVSQTTVTQWKARAKRNTIVLIVVALPLVLLFSPLIIGWLLLLRICEQVDNTATPLPPLPVDPRVYEHPDIYPQSHLTTMVSVRDGFIHKATLAFVLKVTSLLANKVAIAGNLLGIPTIHFARWAMMDDNKRMIFFSNYDGSWASYLGDFVDKAKYGLTAIWGNTDRFPATTWLAFGGAAKMVPFKEWSREHNVYAPFFYRAYSSATVANLTNNIEVRDTIGLPMDEAAASQFLQKL